MCYSLQTMLPDYLWRKWDGEHQTNQQVRKSVSEVGMSWIGMGRDETDRRGADGVDPVRDLGMCYSLQTMLPDYLWRKWDGEHQTNQQVRKSVSEVGMSWIGMGRDETDRRGADGVDTVRDLGMCYSLQTMLPDYLLWKWDEEHQTNQQVRKSISEVGMSWVGMGWDETDRRGADGVDLVRKS